MLRLPASASTLSLPASAPEAPTFSTATLTVRVPALAKVKVSGNDWPAFNGCFSPISMMCMPPGAKLTDWPAGMSMPDIGRIFMTIPDISIVCSSAFFATGVEAATSRSAVGEWIVT